MVSVQLCAPSACQVCSDPFYSPARLETKSQIDLKLTLKGWENYGDLLHDSINPESLAVPLLLPTHTNQGPCHHGIPPPATTFKGKFYYLCKNGGSLNVRRWNSKNFIFIYT